VISRGAEQQPNLLAHWAVYFVGITLNCTITY